MKSLGLGQGCLKFMWSDDTFLISLPVGPSCAQIPQGNLKYAGHAGIHGTAVPSASSGADCKAAGVH